MNDSSFSEPAPEPTSNSAPNNDAEAPPRGPGRPTVRLPQKLFGICQYIRLLGISDTAAAAMCGISRATLSRWKAADEMVEVELEKARAEYQIPRLKVIDLTKRADGELDWRAQAWLVKHAAQGELGRPSPRRKLKDVEVPPPTEEEKAAAEQAELEEGRRQWEETFPDGPKVITTPMLKAMQDARRRYLEFLKMEEAAKRQAASEPVPAAPAPAPEPLDREEAKRKWIEETRARRRAALVRNAQRATGEENPVIDDPHERYVAWQKAEWEKRNNSFQNSEATGVVEGEMKEEAMP